MATMIDRVARAVREEIAYSSSDGVEWMVEGGFRGEDFFTDIARAVLTAMREPTTDMIDAALDVGKVAPYVRERWQAMIDAAISPKP